MANICNNYINITIDKNYEDNLIIKFPEDQSHFSEKLFLHVKKIINKDYNEVSFDINNYLEYGYWYYQEYNIPVIWYLVEEKEEWDTKYYVFWFESKSYAPFDFYELLSKTEWVISFEAQYEEASTGLLGKVNFMDWKYEEIDESYVYDNYFYSDLFCSDIFPDEEYPNENSAFWHFNNEESIIKLSTLLSALKNRNWNVEDNEVIALMNWINETNVKDDEIVYELTEMLGELDLEEDIVEDIEKIISEYSATSWLI